MATIQDIADRWAFPREQCPKLSTVHPTSAKLYKKSVLETAVEMGYSKLRRPGGIRKLCILIENMEYQEPHQFGYEIILGFRQMAERPAIP